MNKKYAFIFVFCVLFAAQSFAWCSGLDCNSDWLYKQELTLNTSGILSADVNKEHAILVHVGADNTDFWTNSSLVTNVTESNYWFVDFPNIDGGHIGCADSVAGGAALTLEFAGAISNVKYWATNMTDAEVIADMNGVLKSSCLANWDMNNGYVNAANAGTYDGTAVGDIILDNNYCEFTSRLKHTCAAPPVVADNISITADNNTGHAIIVKAA